MGHGRARCLRSRCRLSQTGDVLSVRRSHGSPGRPVSERKGTRARWGCRAPAWTGPPGGREPPGALLSVWAGCPVETTTRVSHEADGRLQLPASSFLRNDKRSLRDEPAPCGRAPLPAPSLALSPARWEALAAGSQQPSFFALCFISGASPGPRKTCYCEKTDRDTRGRHLVPGSSFRRPPTSRPSRGY